MRRHNDTFCDLVAALFEVGCWRLEPCDSKGGRGVRRDMLTYKGRTYAAFIQEILERDIALCELTRLPVRFIGS